MNSRRRGTRILLALALLSLAPLGSAEREDWWSYRPLARPTPPDLSPRERALARTPVDRFILARQRKHRLHPNPEADRRTLIRRLSFDLLGMPPAPDEIERFIESRDPRAYERLVDRMLASPRYGERWARHWLDVVHYADTHGYDKDKPRPNAWPYRDYVVRAFNADRPYARFVREQIAGDVLYPESRDGIPATGFIAAGPWDFVGHAEVPESKIDGRIARHIDRDDMVRTTVSTFVSLTAGCARCHDHKFDPISMEDYYGLQAVFAALDRADREYDPDPEVGRRRAKLGARLEELETRRRALDERIRRRAGIDLKRLDARIAKLQNARGSARAAAFGYHSRIEIRRDIAKWVQIDLGRTIPIARITWVGCHDDFNGIGAGFGYPERFKIEVSKDPSFERDVTRVVDRTAKDVPNPGVAPQSVELDDVSARYVRVTATRLALRRNDSIFALAELMVFARGVEPSRNLARDAKVTSLDSIEAPPRWQRSNLVDGYWFGAPGESTDDAELIELRARRAQLLARATDPETAAKLRELTAALSEATRELDALPPRAVVYAGTVHTGSGNFRGTGHNGGRPREIRVLNRGDVRTPGELVGPGALRVVPGLPHRFHLPEASAEGERRRALAEWIVDARNPLTWRSIVNRIWRYHFGRGLVDTPNDFGRMGQSPSHPELLDWLAADFRDSGGSIKRLHRLIVTSAIYRQSSEHDDARAAIDASNRFLWRMNRRRLEAEAVRDAALAVSGRLDLRMFGPGFRCFVLERPEHSPHYEYQKHDPADRASHRRSIYRFIVRSQPDPLMTTLDCADSSQLVAKRNETVTPLQALALLNDDFALFASEAFARSLAREASRSEERIDLAFRRALGRASTDGERRALAAYSEKFGLENACRLILNLNEFVFVD